MAPGGERGPRPHALSSGEVVCFEDLTLGQHWQRGPTRLSADRMIAFAREWDPQPFHLDPEAAARSRFGGLVASGAQTFALAARLFTTTLGIAFAAGRGFDHVRLLRPLRPDVDVHLEVRVVRLKPGPYPDSGQVDFSLKLVDASGHVILSGTAETLVLRRDGSPR